MLRDSFDFRGKSDYEDFFVISREEVALQMEKAKVFLTAVEEYLGTLLIKE